MLRTTTVTGYSGMFGNSEPLHGFLRFLIACFGTGIALVGPLFNRLSVVNWDLPLVSQAASTGAFIGLILTGLVSILITTITKENNPYKCLLDSLGIPGFVIAAAVGLQAVE